MKEGKYVIHADGRTTIGSLKEIHAFMSCRCPNTECPGRAVSAGFFEIDEYGNIEIYGNSTSLDLSPKEGDIEKVQNALEKLFPTNHESN